MEGNAGPGVAEEALRAGGEHFRRLVHQAKVELPVPAHDRDPSPVPRRRSTDA